MRWHRILVALIVVAAASIGGYAFARGGPAPKASSNEKGWTSYAPLPRASHTSTPPGPHPITNLAPGKLTLARLRLPTGAPYFIYGQRIRFQSRLYFCLSAGTPNDSFQDCPSWPLARRPAYLLSGGQCGPPTFELILGILPRKGTSAFLDSPGGPYRATQGRVPGALKVGGDLFYAFVKSTPVDLVLRSVQGNTIKRYPISNTPVPSGCPSAIGPSTMARRSAGIDRPPR